MAGPISSLPYVWQEVPWAEGRVLTRGTEAGLPVLTWGRADREQLATVRQLRELGLRPGGAAPVAVLVFGHTQPCRRAVEHAVLYRIADAVPKCTATPAQRAAIDKALAARRTCDRCGAEQDYYLSTVSRQCGPCEDATGFWDDDRADVVAVGASSQPPGADVETVEVPEQARRTRDAIAAETTGSDGVRVSSAGGLDTAAPRSRPATVMASPTEAEPAQSTTVPGEPAEIGDRSPGRDADGLADADTDTLVAGVRWGDRAALGELYRRYRPLVARYVARRMVCTEDVEDLVHETFLRLPDEVHTFDPATYRFEPWLCGRVARWALIDYGRKERHRHLAAIDTAVDAARRGRVESAEERETRPLSARVVTALARLTPAQRRSVQLRYLDGLSTHAAAAVAGSSPGAVAQNSLAARRRLRTELADLAPRDRSWLDQLSKIDAVRVAFAEVGRADVPAAQAWLRERGVRVDPSYLYAIRNGRRGTPEPAQDRRTADGLNGHAAMASVDTAASTELERSPRAADRGADDPELNGDADLNAELGDDTDLGDGLDDGLGDGLLDEDAFYREAAAELDDVGDLRDVYPPERAAALRMLDAADAPSGGHDHPHAPAAVPRPDSCVLGTSPPPRPERSDATAGAVTVRGRPRTHPRTRDAEPAARDSATTPDIEFTEDEAAETDDDADAAVDDAPGDDDIPWFRQRQSSIAETAGAVERAHEALARLAQARSAHAQDAAGRTRTEQLTRWHADDQAVEDEAADLDDRAAGRHSELEGITR